MEEKLFFPYDREIKIDNTQDGSDIFFKKTTIHYTNLDV